MTIVPVRRRAVSIWRLVVAVLCFSGIANIPAQNLRAQGAAYALGQATGELLVLAIGLWMLKTGLGD